MGATMCAAKMRPKGRLTWGSLDVQERVPAEAFSGGVRPQSAPADSVAGLAAKASPRPAQGRFGQAAQAAYRSARPERTSVQRYVRRAAFYDLICRK